MDLVRQMIDLAVEKQCDAVKFQKRTIDIVYTPEFLASPRESPWGNTQRAQKEGLELGQDQYDEINRYCKEKGIIWFASAWDIPSLHFLRQYNLLYNKIASAMLTHYEFIDEIISEKKITFIGTGMSDYKMIENVVARFKNANCPFILMHCVSEYPALNESLNMRQIVEMRNRFNCPIGYSGHEMTMLPGVIAVLMGAVAIERHITISHALYGSDQAFSLEPRGLETLVNYIRQIPIILGNNDRIISKEEQINAKKLRYFWRES
ncbi:MAG: N-acetylneuraminate synthase family protein [Bifidobacteriaceae bacterium]|nr:N-acetylneuraminate synthase family protein [Bifidobacteriaceae bacterium]